MPLLLNLPLLQNLDKLEVVCVSVCIALVVLDEVSPPTCLFGVDLIKGNVNKPKALFVAAKRNLAKSLGIP